MAVFMFSHNMKNPCRSGGLLSKMKKMRITTLFQAVFLMFFCMLFTGCSNNNDKEKLPILGHREAVTKVVDGQIHVDTVYHQIPPFQFINQDSVPVSDKTFADGVYIANFFFTHCPSICPTMQRNLLKVYEAYKGDYRVKFLSHSIDFRHDKPAVLKEYADKLGVTNDQWQFVTGSKADIYGIADQYMVYTKEDSDAPGGYDHSGYFILVDSDRHIRGAYDGTNDMQIQLLFDELEVLLKEY